MTKPTVLTTIKHFKEMQTMRLFCNACSQWCFENKNFRYDVQIKETWLDFGADWKYTAFITYDEEKENRSWQSFCPRDWELIVNCDSISKIIDMAWYYMDELNKGNICANLYKKF